MATNTMASAVTKKKSELKYDFKIAGLVINDF